MKKFDIVCIAGNSYDQKPWTNRQHIMTRQAKNNWVLYVEPPKYPLFQIIKILLNIFPEQKTHKWFKRIFYPERREKNLYILSLVKFFPTKKKFLRKLNHRLNLFFLKEVMKKCSCENSVLWIYTPDAGDFVGKLKEI